MIDIIFVILFIIFFRKGYNNGLLLALFSFIAVLIGFLAALKLSATVSIVLLDKNVTAAKWAPIIAFISIFFIVVFSIRLLAKLTGKVLKTVKLGWINKMGGGLLYGLIFTLFFALFLWLATKMTIINNKASSNSKVYGIVTPFVPQFFNGLGSLLPFVKKSWEQLNIVFEKVDNQIHHN